MNFDPEKMLRDEMTKAMEVRAAIPFSEGDAMKMWVKMVTPRGSLVRTPLTWGSEEDKYRAMYVAACCAKVLCNQAVLVCSDARRAKTGELCKHFGIPEPTNASQMPAFQKEYIRIIKEHGGTLGNLPKHLYSDFLFVSIKGPVVGTKMLALSYTGDEHDRVKWDGEPELMDGADMRMLDDWWKDDFKVPPEFLAFASKLEAMFEQEPTKQ